MFHETSLERKTNKSSSLLINYSKNGHTVSPDTAKLHAPEAEKWSASKFLLRKGSGCIIWQPISFPQHIQERVQEQKKASEALVGHSSIVDYNTDGDSMLLNNSQCKF